MNQIIEIIVSPQGQTTVQTKGFSGSACQNASRFIEQALGATAREQLTGEYYNQYCNNSVHDQVKQEGQA